MEWISPNQGNILSEIEGKIIEPIEIEINAESYFAEVVHHIQHDRFLAVPTDVERRTASGNHVRTVVSFAGGGELKV